MPKVDFSSESYRVKAANMKTRCYSLKAIHILKGYGASAESSCLRPYFVMTQMPSIDILT